MFRHRRAQEVLTVAAGFALHVCRYLLGVVLCMKVIIYEMRMRPRRNISCLLICSLPLWRVTSHIYDRVVTYYITTASHHHSYSGPRVPGSAASTDAGRWDNSGFRYKLQDAAVECRAAVECIECRAAVVCIECRAAVVCIECTISACFELGCWQSICSSASWAQQRAPPHLWPADHNLSFSKYSDWEWAWQMPKVEWFFPFNKIAKMIFEWKYAMIRLEI